MRWRGRLRQVWNVIGTAGFILEKTWMRRKIRGRRIREVRRRGDQQYWWRVRWERKCRASVERRLIGGVGHLQER